MNRRVLSLGAGVQSTTVYLLAMEGTIPAIDAAVFADTQEEPGAVYAHLQWLVSLGGPPIVVRSIGKLGDHLANGENTTGQRCASIPAYTAQPGIRPATGMIRRQCTKEYKTQVVDRAIRRDVFGLPPRRALIGANSVQLLFGISVDEARRAGSIKARVETKRRWSVVFPLLDLGWSRRDCEKWLSTRVPHEVPRSACVFCPFKSNAEWKRLKTHDPEGWDRAVFIDRQLRIPGNVLNRKLNQQLFLHRSARPLDEVEFDQRQEIFGFIRECEAACGT